jgi:hypothetical protein
MQARDPRIWQRFGNFELSMSNFELSMKDRLNLINAFDDWTQSLIDAGWSPYLLTFMFSPLPGNQNSKIHQMRREVEKFYSKLLTRVVRRPNSSCDKPVLFAFVDLPVAKKDKISTIDAVVNDGLHFHAIVLIPPNSRLSVPLDLHIASLSQVYLGDRRKLDHIDVKPFYTEKSFRVVDYALKALKKKLDYDDFLIFPKASSECHNNFSQKKQVKTMKRQNAHGAGMNPAGCRVSEMVLSGQLDAVEGAAVVAEAATRAGLERDEAERTARNSAGAIPMLDKTGTEIVDAALKKPELVIHASDLPAAALAVDDVLAGCEDLYDRGGPVRLIRPRNGKLPRAKPLSKNQVVVLIHRLCQPVKKGSRGNSPITLPDRVAQFYLEMGDETGLPPLNGICTGPILLSDSSIRVPEGYDADTGLWCCSIPRLDIPDKPSRSDAEAALLDLRRAFRTFPFADAARRSDASIGVEVVDIDQPPGTDESGFLIALLTAVCRPSLERAPGFLVNAPLVSGAGSGKGLLVRALCEIAFGVQPRAFTAGSDKAELDKRLGAELIEANPALFLDNCNGLTLQSATLASAITECPARVRPLGASRMLEVNTKAFIAVTGNGAKLSEDLVRRFMVCNLDAKCEDPESRPFEPGFLDSINRRRAELLTAALTIWRWGRQNKHLPRGKPLGSFETWAEWCRDPLVALGCLDPVARIGALKANDPFRQDVVEIYRIWWRTHEDSAVRVSELSQCLIDAIDPQQRGRQYQAKRVADLANARVAGFVLTRQKPAGKWGAATYALHLADDRSTGQNGRRPVRRRVSPYSESATLKQDKTL